jgi:hypothetical protein
MGSGVAAGAAISALAVFAHVTAGGSLTGWAPLVGLVAVMTATTATAPRLRWTFPRVAAAAMLLQPLLHVAFAAGHSSAPGHASAHADHLAHAARHDLAGHAVAGHSLAMPVAHVAIALVTAVLLRWGLRWLRAMPGLLRTLVAGARPDVRWVLPQVRMAAPAAALVPVDVARVPWDSRGPPRVV